MLGPEKNHIQEIIRTPSPDGGGSAFEDLRKNFRRPGLHFELQTEFRRGPIRRQGRGRALWSWMASLIDSCILLGASSLFVLVFAKVMRTPTASVFKDLEILDHSISALGFLALILIGASWFYMVFCRGLFGASLGESLCDLRLGAPQDEEKPQFIFKVLFRASLILGTGLFLLPLLSLITGKDVAGQICGLRLFSLK